MPSLARSVPKPLKVPSLARSVPKPRVGGSQNGGSRRATDASLPSLSTPYQLVVSESEVKVIRFWSFDFPKTFVCYRGYFKLNCYIGKKVQTNFLMGLKIW